MLYDEHPGKVLCLELAALLVVLGSPVGCWVAVRKSKDLQHELDALGTMDQK